MNVFQKYLASEFAEDYQEGRLSRREAPKLIASVTGSLLLADSILAACAPPPEGSAAVVTTGTSAPTAIEGLQASATLEPATPEEVQETSTASPDDSQIQAEAIEFPGQGATLLGYLARPGQDGSFPVILVCHENRGLTEHIQDVTRRLAKAGDVALAVDLLSREGGSQALGTDQVPGALGNMPPEQFVQDFVSGWQYLGSQPFAQADRVGMVGFGRLNPI